MLTYRSYTKENYMNVLIFKLCGTGLHGLKFHGPGTTRFKEKKNYARTGLTRYDNYKLDSRLVRIV